MSNQAEEVFHGRARILGDDVNTDYIISSSRKKESVDPQILRQFLLEDLDPDFAASVRPGDILVAGRNFGCGSAMEVAVTVVMGAGIRAVVAKSFARTYWRNAVNNGLLLITADMGSLREDDELEVRLTGSQVEIAVASDGYRVVECEPVDEIVQSIRREGGLVAYLRTYGGFPSREAKS
jgi:3-isopropylmalate/(R)-2-methylmalate dehydratase small subunit